MSSSHTSRIILSIVLIFSIVIPPSFVLAAPRKPGATSVLVQPIGDNDHDAESEALARTIADAMTVTTQYKIIDFDRAAGVLDYYEEIRMAPSAGGEAETSLETAKDHYFQFRYDEAVAELHKAISLLEARRDEIDIVGPKLLDACLSLAVVTKSQKKTDAARMALSSALQLNPRLELSESDYSPSFVALFREVKGEQLSVPGASIHVVTKPPATNVYLNGISQGVTPLKMDKLPSGTYQLSIRANKYRPVNKKIEVSSGDEIRVRERLRWASKYPSERKKMVADTAAELRMGLAIADTMKADKVILIDVDSAGGAATVVKARMVDRKFRAGQPPVVIPKGTPEDKRVAALADMVESLSSQVDANLIKNPVREVDPLGIGDPVLLGNRKKPLVHSPIFWGAIGIAAAGAIAGGVAAAVSESSSSGKGSVRVRLK